jgi:hypothetical protein
MTAEWIDKLAEQQDGQSTADRTPKALPFRHHRDRNLSMPKFLVKGLLPETGIGLLSGQTSTYKTFVGLKLAGAVGMGKPFLNGHGTKRRGATLIFTSEGANELPVRLEALSQEEHDGHRLPIYFCSQPVGLLDPTAIQDIIMTCSEVNDQAMRDHSLPLVMVMFDTLIGCAGFAKAGDENDSVIGAKLMDALTQISHACEAFVLGIDHFGKATETGTRGSSAKEAAADVVLAILANKATSGDVTACRLAIRKSRGGPSGVEYGFNVHSVDLGEDEDGDRVTSLTIKFDTVALQPQQEDGAWTKSTAHLRRVLMALLATDGETIQPFPGGPDVRAIRSDTVRDEYIKQIPAEDDDPKKGRATRRRSFNRLVVVARDRDLVCFREIDGVGFLWLAPKGK